MREIVLVAVLRQRDAVDQLHHEIGPARVGRPRVEHVGDVGVVHQGQGLTLGLKPGDNRAGVHARLDDLQGDLAADGFPLLGHVHDAEAAFADLLQQLVAADGGAGAFGQRGQVEGGGGLLEKLLGFRIGFQQFSDLCSESLVPRTGVVEVRGTLVGQLNFQGCPENGVRLLRLVGHGAIPEVMLYLEKRKRRARASRNREKIYSEPRWISRCNWQYSHVLA